MEGKWTQEVGEGTFVASSATRVACTPGFIRSLFDLATLSSSQQQRWEIDEGRRRRSRGFWRGHWFEVGVVVGDLTWKVLLYHEEEKEAGETVEVGGEPLPPLFGTFSFYRQFGLWLKGWTLLAPETENFNFCEPYEMRDSTWAIRHRSSSIAGRLNLVARRISMYFLSARTRCTCDRECII